MRRWLPLGLTLLAVACGPEDADELVEEAQGLGQSLRRVDMGVRSSARSSVPAGWEADPFWSGAPGEGVVDRGTIKGLARLYQTEHYCLSGLSFQVPDGEYSVRLHFAETYWDSAGDRVFDVKVECRKFNNFDVFFEAGGKNRPVVRTFERVRVQDGRVNIEFPRDKDTKNCSMINAVELYKENASAPTPAVNMGVNLISDGNDYDGSAHSDANLDELFGKLKAAGFKAISVRVIWQRIEPTKGSYNQAIIDNLKRVLAKAGAHGLDAMLDFHTLFGAEVQWWMAPTWLKSVAPQRSWNGETIPAGSLRHLFADPKVRTAYADMMRAVLEPLTGQTALKYVSLMNEPWLNYQSDQNIEAFDGTVRYLVERARQYTTKPLGVRFLADWNPWADEPNKRIGAGSWRSLDYVGMNQYFLPAWFSELKKHGTTAWPMAHRALAAVHGAGKKFLVTEVGVKDASGPCREDDWNYLLKYRYNAYRPDLILIWNAQNDGAYFSEASPSSYNILSGMNTIAPYTRETIVPHLK